MLKGGEDAKDTERIAPGRKRRMLLNFAPRTETMKTGQTEDFKHKLITFLHSEWHNRCTSWSLVVRGEANHLLTSCLLVLVTMLLVCYVIISSSLAELSLSSHLLDPLFSSYL